MTPNERPYLAAALWLQLREETLKHPEIFGPQPPINLRNVWNQSAQWTAHDDTQFTAAYREWLRKERP